MTTTLRHPTALSALAAVVDRFNSSKPNVADELSSLRQQVAVLEAENARLQSRVDYLESLNQRDADDLPAPKRGKSAPAAPPKMLTVKEFARRHAIGERTLYRRRDAGLLVRPDGSQGWVPSGGGDLQDHYMIYADALIHHPTPKTKKPKKAS